MSSCDFPFNQNTEGLRKYCCKAKISDTAVWIRADSAVTSPNICWNAHKTFNQINRCFNLCFCTTVLNSKLLRRLQSIYLDLFTFWHIPYHTHTRKITIDTHQNTHQYSISKSNISITRHTSLAANKSGFCFSTAFEFRILAENVHQRTSLVTEKRGGFQWSVICGSIFEFPAAASGGAEAAGRRALAADLTRRRVFAAERTHTWRVNKWRKRFNYFSEQVG